MPKVSDVRPRARYDRDRLPTAVPRARIQLECFGRFSSFAFRLQVVGIVTRDRTPVKNEATDTAFGEKVDPSVGPRTGTDPLFLLL